ncbi:MAG: hypothetical protein IJ124_09445 [Clostridia bacterium]|nr:hypothetical protein [Clostridia bacterium]
MGVNAVGMWLGRLLMAGYIALTAAAALRYFKTALAEPVQTPAPPAGRTPWPKLLAWALGAFVASRLLVALSCAAVYAAENRTLAGFLTALKGRLRPWDADHYLGIIENMYVTEGDARFHIVFLPFFPAVCRALRWLTGMSPFAAAETVANGALLGSGWAMFRLTEDADGPDTARRAMLLLMFCPMAYFYSIPYTESVFMLVTLLAVLCARRRRWGWALLFGAMASNTRVVGIAVAIPIFWEYLRAAREADAARGLAETGSVRARRAALCALKVLPVSAGLLAYLYVNYRLYGNPTQFMIFQQENWYQSFGSMAYTFQNSFANALQYDDFLYRLGVWWPQVALLAGVPLLALWRRGREHPADTAYLLVTHYVNFAPTWLLSGPRYLSATYALYPMLARIPRGRKGFAALLTGECALLVYMSVVGLWYVKVY